MQNHEEEELKTKFLRQVYQLIYEYKFAELINLIQVNYSSFANNNQNIIYILMKLNFIKIILYQQDFSAANDYYTNHLLLMMKKIYGEKSNSYYNKNFKYQYFMKIINTSQAKYIYLQNHFKLENHLDKLMNLIEKKLEKKRRERNPVIFNIVKTKSITDKEMNENNTINNNHGKMLFKTEHVNMLVYNNENMSEIEDELFKLNLEERKKNIFNVQNSTINKLNNTNENIILGNEIEFNMNNSEECNMNDISNSNTSSCIELNLKKINSKKFEEKRENSPIMNNDKQKFNLNNKIRRVNLCKKIVRKFKKYLKKNIKDITDSFWTSFCRENYLPPFKKEEVEFKSFSQIYLNWLFSHQGGIELYSQFIRNSGEEELIKIYSSYNVNDPEDKITIKKFFINFAAFFANLKLSEIRNNSDSINNIDNINNISINKGLFSEPDFATNLFGNFNYNIRDEEEELSIGSIKDFIYEERNFNINEDDKNKEFIRQNCNNIEKIENEANNNKMVLSSDSSNSSFENMNRSCNININKNHNMKYNISNINNPFFAANSHSEDFFMNNLSKKMENKNEIYPDMNTFDYGYENKIKESPSESIYFFNKEEIDKNDKYFKKED